MSKWSGCPVTKCINDRCDKGCILQDEMLLSHQRFINGPIEEWLGWDNMRIAPPQAD
jgi:hypothetical protein